MKTTTATLSTHVLTALCVSLFLFAASMMLPQVASADEHGTSTDETATSTEDTASSTDEEADEESDDSSELNSEQLASMLATIQSLMAQIEDLQTKLNKIRNEIRTVIRDGIREGMTGDDIRQIQELLATDPEIYPEGYTTGYFGSLTKGALKRFQDKFGLEATGEIDEDTRALLEELLEQRFGEDIPKGLLQAPGILKKVRDGVCEDRDNSGKGHGLLCKDHKKDHDDEDEDEHEDEDEDENEDEDEGEEVNEEDAQEAIDDAQAVIDALEEAINDAEDGSDKDDAEAAYDDAVLKLAEAQTAFDDEDYEGADELADEAEDIAEDAYEELTGEAYEEGELMIEVEIHDDVTHVHVTYENGDTESFNVDADYSDEEAVIADIVAETGLDEEDVEDAVEFVE